MLKNLTDCIETDLTISVAIDRQNCDRLYSRIRPLGRSHGYGLTVKRADSVLSVLLMRWGSRLDRGRGKRLKFTIWRAVDTRYGNWLKSFSKFAP
jgi:hypothetical protein